MAVSLEKMANYKVFGVNIDYSFSLCLILYFLEVVLVMAHETIFRYCVDTI